MPVIDYIDGANRDIYLHADTVGAEVNPIDIYREMRTLRRTDESLRKWNLFLEAKGYDNKGPGKFTERYVVCLEGTRIIPFDVTHQITITGTIITDDGQEGISCFDRTPLSGSTVVDINYVPPQVEVIVVTGGSGLDAIQDEMLTEIYNNSRRIVFVDTNNVAYGDGSAVNPFNTIAAAMGYASVKGINTMYIKNNCVFDADVTGMEVHGITVPYVDFNGFSVESSDFFNMFVGGSSTGQATYRDCMITDGFSGLNGILNNCALGGDVIMQPGTMVLIDKSFSGIPGTNRPSLSFGGVPGMCAFRSWSGGIEIRDQVAGSALTVELSAGECRHAASCTGGDAHIRGVGYYENLGNISPVTRSLVTGEVINNVWDRLTEIWQLSSLDPSNPQTITDDERRVASIVLQMVKGPSDTVITRV